MPITTISDFFQLLKKSNLLSQAQLSAARDVASGQKDQKAYAISLIRQKLLTKWQAEQLLAGRNTFFLGKYRLMEKIGEGGMGSVFKAIEQAGMQRTMALKMLSKGVLSKPDSVPRFLREVQAAAALSHPNIVAAYDADCVGKTYFLVMEYVAGKDLNAWIKQFGQLPIEWACECARQTALGLQHAHEQGLVHRDIKPSNVLVVSEDATSIPVVKILDMGLARFSEETGDSEITKTGQVIGTIDYISPEQARHTKDADIRSDIYSLGCTLFKLLTTQVPFAGENLTEKLTARFVEDAPRLRSLRADIPQALDNIVATMLAKDPRDRYQTPQEVADELAPFALSTKDEHERMALELSDQTSDTLDEGDDSINEFLETLGTDVPQGDKATSAATQNSRASSVNLPEKEPAQRKNVALLANRNVLIGAVSLGVMAVLLVGMMFMQTGFVPGAHGESSGEGESASPIPTIMTEREIAVWIFKQKGSILVVPQGSSSAVRANKFSDLPKRTFQITQVSLVDKKPLSVADAKRLSRLDELIGVDMRYKIVDSAALDELKKCKKLMQLRFVASSSESVARLKEFDRLRTIEVSGGLVTDADLPVFEQIPTLQQLSLANSKITDEGLTQLGEIKKLSSLTLAGCSSISAAGLENLKNLTQLDTLSLSRTNIGNAGIEYLFAFPKLRIVFLDGTGITDEGVARLVALKRLKRLDLSNNRITDRSAADLERMAHLTDLYLRSTGLSPYVLNNLRASFPGTIHGVPEPAKKKLLPFAWRSNAQELVRLGAILTIHASGRTRVVRTPVALKFIRNAKIVGIDLTGVKLNQRVLTLVARFRGLQELSLSRTNATDLQISRTLGLSALRKIDLSYTHLTDKGMQYVNRPDLNTIHLAGTKITATGLSRLKSIRWLESLNLNSVDLRDKGMESISRFIGLTELELRNANLSDSGVKHLLKMEKLTRLALDGNPGITDASVQTLKQLQRLKQLSFQGTKISETGAAELRAALPNCRFNLATSDDRVVRGIAAKVLQLRGHLFVTTEESQRPFVLNQIVPKVPFSIQTIHLSDTAADDAFVESLAGLTSLIGLYLNGTQVGDDGIKHLRQIDTLTELELANTQITGTGLRELARLPNLKRLRLGKTSLKDADIEALSRMSQLKWLDLSNTQISGSGLRFLAELPKIEILVLANAQITGSDLAHLKRLSSLAVLSLQGANIGNQGLEHLEELAALQNLQLDNTEVDDAGLAVVARLKSLKNLQLAGTAISDTGLKLLREQTNLRILDVQRTQVTKAGINAFRSAHPECTVLSNFDLDRKAAKWAQSIGATIGVKVIGEESIVQVLPKSPLPDKPFVVTQVILVTRDVAERELIDRLCGLTELESINIFNVPVSNESVEAFAKIPNLSVLRLYSTRITDEGLVHLKKYGRLQYLGVGYCDVSDKGLAHLHSIETLKKVELQVTKVSATGIAALEAALPNCQVVSLADAERRMAQEVLAADGKVAVRVNDRQYPVDKFSKLPAEHFHITSISYYGAKPNARLALTHLHTLPELSLLDLRGTKITDEQLGPIATIRGLRILNLSGTQVSDEGVKHLERMTNLTQINLRGTNVTAEQVQQLRMKLRNCNIQFGDLPKRPPEKKPKS